MDLEKKILRTLGNFVTVDYSTLKQEVLSGDFTLALEQDFDLALEELKKRGRVSNPVRFGQYWLTPERKTGNAPRPRARAS